MGFIGTSKILVFKKGGEMDFTQVFKLFERLAKERFFGKLEIKFRNGTPYFCIRQEFMHVTAKGMIPVEPMSQDHRSKLEDQPLKEEL